MIKSEVIIVGGGAAGLMAAIVARENGHEVRVIEKMNKIGKKLLATGNGKCNLTNTFLDNTCYRSVNQEFPYQVIQHFGATQTMEFFRSLGLQLRDRDGYIYPYSEQAVTILDAMQSKLYHLKVSIDTDTYVTAVKKEKGVFTLTTNQDTYACKVLLLATGGKSYENLGSDGSGYRLAKSLGHRVVRTVPALVALHSPDPCFKEWSGIRTQCRVGIWVDHNLCSSAEGEIQLTNYGISGVPTFQVSRYASWALSEKHKVLASLNFMPGYTEEEMVAALASSINLCSYKNLTGVLQGMFHKKLVNGLIVRAQLDPYLSAAKMGQKEIVAMAKTIQNYEIEICGTNDFDQAQVTAGGVSTKEIHFDTMESKLVPNLYIIGELLDVDGTCGGYNLQWAWTTGRLAGNHMGNQ